MLPNTKIKMTIIHKRYSLFLFLFSIFVCKSSQKRDGILPEDKIARLESKNRDLNLINEDNKKDYHVYPILDVELKQVIDTPNKD